MVNFEKPVATFEEMRQGTKFKAMIILRFCKKEFILTTIQLILMHIQAAQEMMHYISKDNGRNEGKPKNS